MVLLEEIVGMVLLGGVGEDGVVCWEGGVRGEGEVGVLEGGCGGEGGFEGSGSLELSGGGGDLGMRKGGSECGGLVGWVCSGMLMFGKGGLVGEDGFLKSGGLVDMVGDNGMVLVF